jgi:hypothetical protein
MGNYINLAGQRFTKLVALRVAEGRAEDGSMLWECLCDCGKLIITSSNKLRMGRKLSCGCIIKDRVEAGTFAPMKDISGLRFGRLLVIERTCVGGSWGYWKCQCDCGNFAVVETYSLTSYSVQSCGCLGAEMQNKWFKPTHRMTGSLALKRWTSIKERCLNPNQLNYHNYGGRGITVCDRWLDKEHGFENFYADIGDPPSSDYQLDRIDNNGPYSPENCRWATVTEQGNNRRTNIHITIFGITKSFKDICREFGFRYTLSVARYSGRKWDILSALLIPNLQKMPNKKFISDFAKHKRILNALKY